MASCAADGVKLWDLRKLRNFKSLAPYEAAPTTSVAFDFSGLYLAVGGAGGCLLGCCCRFRCCLCVWGMLLGCVAGARCCAGTPRHATRHALPPTHNTQHQQPAFFPLTNPRASLSPCACLQMRASTA